MPPVKQRGRVQLAHQRRQRRWSGESLETLRGYATKASWHKGRRLREGSEVPSWSEGVLTELYRDEVRQLRAREPAVVENWPRWSVPDSR